MKSKKVAYFLYFIGMCGYIPLHRSYLGVRWPGIAWFLTFGYLYIGLISDFFKIKGWLDAPPDYDDANYEPTPERGRDSSAIGAMTDQMNQVAKKNFMKGLGNVGKMVTGNKLADAQRRVESAQLELSFAERENDFSRITRARQLLSRAESDLRIEERKSTQ